MKNFKILLIGQPNIGKSSLLNALVGSKVVISNYPGTTVEITEGEKIFDKIKMLFKDTPGIYSISDRSEEEKITEKALFEEKIDGAIIIVDSSSLERSLYIVLQVLEAHIPVIIALNFIEDARNKGIKIDYEKLEKILNVSIIPINPLKKQGINKLIKVILKIEETTRKTFTVRYDDHIEKAIDKISSKITKTSLPKRFIALRVLEEDKDFYRYLKDKRVVKEVKRILLSHPAVSEDISITRYGTGAFIAGEITQISKLKDGDRHRNLEEQIDKVFLHNVWGFIFTVLFWFVILNLLLFFGNLLQTVLLGFTDKILSYIDTLNSSIITLIFSQALYGVMVGISVALPYVFLFYLILGLTEDIGLLPRFIVSLDRFLRKIGLSGKAFIPLALGLGCTVPAIRATRILSSKEERVFTCSFFPFVSCSSRIGIIMGIVGYYGGVFLGMSVYITLLISALIWAFIIKKVTHLKSQPLLLELPPYRKPLMKNIINKSWIRMRDFVYLVIPLLAVGGMIYAILNMTGITKSIIEPLSLFTRWLGLPAATIIPLVFGFLQKDLTSAMLLSVLGSNISLVLTPIQIYTFGVAATMQIPCIIALGMLVREFGLKKAILLTGISIIYGFLFAGLIWRIISIFGKYLT